MGGLNAMPGFLDHYQYTSRVSCSAPGHAKGPVCGEIGTAKDRAYGTIASSSKWACRLPGVHRQICEDDGTSTRWEGWSPARSKFGSEFYLDSQLTFTPSTTYEFFVGVDNMLNKQARRSCSEHVQHTGTDTAADVLTSSSSLLSRCASALLDTVKANNLRRGSDSPRLSCGQPKPVDEVLRTLKCRSVGVGIEHGPSAPLKHQATARMSATPRPTGGKGLRTCSELGGALRVRFRETADTRHRTAARDLEQARISPRYRRQALMHQRWTRPGSPRRHEP